MAETFLSSDDKTSIKSVFDDFHTFRAKTITVYHPAQKTIAKNEDFNAMFKHMQNSTDITYTPVTYEIEARLKFSDSMDREKLSKEMQLMGIEVPKGSVKITVKDEDKSKLQKAERIQYDGVQYDLISDIRTAGIFGEGFYSAWARPIE
jgi:hypothetical protein